MFCSTIWLMHRAVLDHTIGKDLPEVGVESFECLPGQGLYATLSGIMVELLSLMKHIFIMYMLLIFTSYLIVGKQ
jgi:hypothetical protein